MSLVMYHTLSNLWIDLLRKGLAEDGHPWDWTTLGIPSRSVGARVLAKSDGVWAAQTLVDSLNQLFPGVKAKSLLADGERFKKGKVLVQLTGPSDAILALERPFLNLAAYVSGIASMTAEVVNRVREVCPKNPPRVTLTRKTLPGYRDLAIHGVRCGGGYPHRVSLSGGVLIKENHIAAAGGIAQAIQAARRSAPHGLKIEIEVRNRSELKKALISRADVIMLDNFLPSQVQDALQLLEAESHRPLIEVSGGLTLKSIKDYSISGVDILSVGSLTHSVQCVDLSLLVE